VFVLSEGYERDRVGMKRSGAIVTSCTRRGRAGCAARRTTRAEDTYRRERKDV
jgi:hypothetical protein